MSDDFQDDGFQDDIDDTQDDPGGSEDDLIQQILGDDDYEPEGDDGLEDGEEEDKEGDGEDREEEDEKDEEDTEDEKGEGESELESILGQYEEEQTERDADDERAPDPYDVTDQDIAHAVYVSDDYKDWMDAAAEEGVVLDDSFAALLGKNRVDPELLTRNNIFDMKSMAEHMESLHKNQDPDRLVVPDEDAEPEEWRGFLKEAFNVPEARDGYGDDLFAETFLQDEGMEGIRDAMKTMFHENFFSEEQAYALIDLYDTDRKSWLESQRKDAEDYRHTQEAAMRREYREDYNSVIKDMAGMIKKYGPEFREEFLHEKVMNSASFARMLHRMMNDSAAPGRLQMRSMSMDIRSLSREGLGKIIDRLHEERKQVGEYKKFAKSTEKSEKKLYRRYKSNTIKLNEAMSEANRRGLEYN